MPSPLSLLLDPAQTRLSADGMSVLVSGRDWSPSNNHDVWIDPITNTCMLRPACFYPEWATTNIGIYAKYGFSDFTLTDSSNWTSHQPDLGGPFMQYIGPTGNTAGLHGLGPTQPMNQPMVVEWFGQPSTNSPYGIFECGWSNTGDGTSGVSLRFYADGRAEVWKAGQMIGTYSLGGNQPDYFNSHWTASTQFMGGATPQAPKVGYVQTILIPCRDRELLVLSSMGGGFCHIFEDLSEATGGQTITDAAPFWFNIPAPSLAVVRIARLQFASNGSVCGIPTTWRLAPPLNTTQDPVHGINAQIRVFRDLSGGGSVSSSVMNPGNPPTINTPPLLPVLIQLSLSGGPSTTPFVYGARAWYDPKTSSTTSPSDGPLDLLPYISRFHLDVADTIGGTRATVQLMRPAAIETAGGLEIARQCHRALQVSDEHGMILDGVTEPPHWRDASGLDSGSADRNREIQIEIRDRWKLAEEAIFSDPIPLDGISLADAYRFVAASVGIPSSQVYISPSASLFTLSNAGSASGGDWNVLIEVGDKGAEWLDRLHQTYASTWFHGFRPDPTDAGHPPILCLVDPADTTTGYALPASVSIVLYRTIADAVTGGTSEALAYRRVYRSYRTQILEPEANDIWVTGCDPRTRKPILVHRQTPSMATDADPTIAPSGRSANWLGGLRKYGWIDPSLKTQVACQHVANLLSERLTTARELVEFECEYLPGIWRGDLVQLDQGPGSDPVTVRIKAFSGEFAGVSTFAESSVPDAVWRPFRYVGEVTPIVAPLDVNGSSIRNIGVNWHSLKALSKQRVFEDGARVARRPTQSLTVL